MAHALIHLTENLGYSLATAGLVLPALTFWQITGQLSGGFLGDRFDKRIIATICMALHCVGILALAYAQNVAMMMAFAALHGWAWGARGPLMQAIRADCFGTASFGKIMGVSSMIVALGSSAGPLIAGFLADRTGKTGGFTVLAGSRGWVCVLCWPAPLPPRGRRPGTGFARQPAWLLAEPSRPQRWPRGRRAHTNTVGPLRLWRRVRAPAGDVPPLLRAAVPPRLPASPRRCRPHQARLTPTRPERRRTQPGGGTSPPPRSRGSRRERSQPTER
jgi:MFS family permease